MEGKATMIPYSGTPHFVSYFRDIAHTTFRHRISL